MIERTYAEKVAKTARRKPANEAGLLWSFTACVVFFIVLFAAPTAFMESIGQKMDAMAFAILCGIITGGVISLIYYLIVRPKIAAAIIENNEIMKAYREKREQEKQDKIAKMKANEANNA